MMLLVGLRVKSRRGGVRRGEPNGAGKTFFAFERGFCRDVAVVLPGEEPGSVRVGDSSSYRPVIGL